MKRLAGFAAAVTAAVAAGLFASPAHAATSNAFPDHGGGPLPELHGGARLGEDALIAMINQRFDKRDNRRPLALSATSTQIYLDDAELRANGVTPAQVRDWLKGFRPDGKPFFAAVYTRAEIEAMSKK